MINGEQNESRREREGSKSERESVIVVDVLLLLLLLNVENGRRGRAVTEDLTIGGAVGGEL
jgi:hypothetical protein